MADLLRLVELDAGGRPYGIHTLNVAAQTSGGRYLERGTLTFTPGPVQPRTRPRSDRFGGSHHAGETRENGSLAGTWHQRGSSVDDAIAKLEAFFAAANLSDRPRLLEFLPEKASPTRKSYFETRGPATVQPRYSYNALNGAFMVACEVSFPTAPLVQGPPMRIRDTFDVPPDATLLYTNLATNPRAGVDLTGIGSVTAGVVLSRIVAGNPNGADTGVEAVGTAVAAATAVYASWGRSGNGTGAAAHPVPPGGRVAARLWARIVSIGSGSISNLNMRLYWYKADGSTAATAFTTVQSQNPPVVGTDYEFTGLVAVPADAYYCSPRLLTTQANPTTATIRSTLALLTPVAATETVVPGYFDGDFDRANWAGAAHGSESRLYDRTTLSEDYTVIAGTPKMTNGQIAAAGPVTDAHTILHTGRGYAYSDGQARGEYLAPNVPAANQAATFYAGPAVKALGGSSVECLFAAVTRTTGAVTALTLYRREQDGTNTSLGGTLVGAVGVIADGARFWVTGRVEGDLFTAEYWTAEPTPAGTPTASRSVTLTGTDAAKFGAAARGYFGPAAYWVPSHQTATIESFRYAPYFRKALATPTTIDVAGIPGDAPAVVDVELALAANAPKYGLIAWTDKAAAAPAAGANVPFGTLEIPGATGLVHETGFASTAVGGTLNGNVSRAALSSGGGTARLYIPIDPSTLCGDAWQGDTLPLEVYLCIYLPASAVTPRITSWAEPIGGQAALRSYATPHGSGGRPLTLPATGTAWRRFTKLGVVLVDRTSARLQRLYVELNYGPGSSGNIDLDYLFLAPGRRRLSSPTEKAADATYPTAIEYSPSIKTIRSDGRGRIRDPGDLPAAAAPAAAMGGQRLELNPGDSQVAVKLSTMVPDNPAIQDLQENLQETATVSLDITPRWLAFRGG